MSFWIRGDIWNSPPVIRSAASWIGYSLWSRHRQNECMRSWTRCRAFSWVSQCAHRGVKSVVNCSACRLHCGSGTRKGGSLATSERFTAFMFENHEVYPRAARRRRTTTWTGTRLIDRLISKALLNWETRCSVRNRISSILKSRVSGAISRACLSVVREFETVPDDRKRALQIPILLRAYRRVSILPRRLGGG